MCTESMAACVRAWVPACVGSRGGVGMGQRVQEFEDIMSTLATVMEDDLDEDDYQRLEVQKVPDWVKRALMANHVPDTNRVKVNEVLQEVYKVGCPLAVWCGWRCVPTHHVSCRPMPCLQLIVRYLKDVSKPLPTHIKNMWRQAMLGDPKVGWFFQRSGGVLPDSDEGKAVAGEWARVCPGGANMYFVANLNHFGALGGFDAALERIRCSEPSAPLPEVALITNLLYIGRFLYTVCRRACGCGCCCLV